MSHSLGYGTSSGDLNTGGNLSESSFLEALFGLEFGHADDADFSSLLFVCPTDFTDFHRFLRYAGWDFADDADFSSLLFDCPTDSTEFHRFLPYAGWDFASNLQISCYFLGGFEKKAYFCGRIKRLK